MLTAVVGINWGDEGKGRMVDLLSADCDAVVRYQGGNNAGHTVKNDQGTFILHLLPSGILREGVVNVMGPGMVIDLEALCDEINALEQAGVSVTPENLRISDRAVIVLPYHVRQDVLEETRLGDRAYGSTRRGIAPVYGDKYLKKALHMNDLLFPNTLKEKVDDILDWKNLTLEGVYGDSRMEVDEVLSWLHKWGDRLRPYICDTSVFLEQEDAKGGGILFEAQLGALRDIDYGIYPYTSSSNTLAAFAPIGSGLPGRHLDHVLGIVKAYSTCVGEGPFTVELSGDEAEKLRQAGGEYGASTGRPRRVGPFDAVATRYGVRMQGADELALTKLDVLSGFETIPVCTAYEIDGVETEDFPFGDRLEKAKPVITQLPGWLEDISAVRRYEDLPASARRYVEFLEEAIGAPFRYISVGPDRDAYIEKSAA